MKKNKKLLFSVTIKDCDIATFCTGGPGGQKQNKTASGVRITHRASGAVGEGREHRSQNANKKAAWERMGKSKTFQAWAKVQAARIQGEPSIEEVVEKALAESNIKEEWRCQFCEKINLVQKWMIKHQCPDCGLAYDAELAQDES